MSQAVRKAVHLREEYQLFIGGEFTPAGSGETSETRSPASGELLARVASAGSDDVGRAVSAAKQAYPAWRDTSVSDRAAVLFRMADRLEKEREHVAAVETLDTGRPIVETRLDVDAVVDQLRYFAGAVRAHEDAAVMHDRETMSILVREPYGVVGQIVPWNFPILIAGWKIAPALAAGNTVVIKPATNTPLSLLEFARICGGELPPGTLNVVTGPGRSCGEAILQHPDIAKLGFTGSTEVGCRVARVAADRVVPSTLELGGKSANIVFPDAPMEKAIEGAAMGILYSQGQVCNAGSRLFLHEDIHDSFIEKLAGQFRTVRIGDPLDESVRMGPMATEDQLDTVLRYVEIGKQEGAHLVYGGNRITGEEFAKGYYVEPALFTGVTNDMRIAREEIFGPVLSVIRFSDEDSVVRMANDTEYGLAGAVWTRDINRALRVAKSVETGTMWVNEYNMVPSHSPFGGYKKSGYGREAHKMALEYYTQVKNIYISQREEPWGWF